MASDDAGHLNPEPFLVANLLKHRRRLTAGHGRHVFSDYATRGDGHEVTCAYQL